MKILENNQVTLCGTIASECTFSHEVLGEGFYMVDLSVERLSGSIDTIPLIISERLLDIEKYCRGCAIEVVGQFRSYNRHDGETSHLVLSVFVRDIHFLEKPTASKDINQIYLDGYICKVPVYRKTPLGREIADLLLAVNRPYGKADYIPCVVWGRNARYASQLEMGSRMQIHGRIQSREYTKKLSDTQCEKRIAYEVSINKMEVISDENKN